jgi:hypothetical protein
MPTGSAVNDLGLGGDLAQQVAGETDEERKKRMEQMKQAQLLGPAGSMAATALLGQGTGRRAGY